MAAFATPALLAPSAARAALQPAVPAGDDAGFLAFGATAESVGLAFYKRARALHVWTPGERKRLGAGERAKRTHIAKLNAALGPADAVLPDDFVEAVTVSDRAGALKLGIALEDLVVGVYLNGAGYAQDAGTRVLLARLASACSQQAAQLRVLAGLPAAGGLPSPIDLEPAGARLDAFLKDPT